MPAPSRSNSASTAPASPKRDLRLAESRERHGHALHFKPDLYPVANLFRQRQASTVKRQALVAGAFDERAIGQIMPAGMFAAQVVVLLRSILRSLIQSHGAKIA